LHTSDEHTEDGHSTEDAEEVKAMSEKRARKILALKTEIPEPTLYGNPNSDTVFIGYGSTKNALLDTIQINENISYLHFEYIFPLKADKILKFVQEGKRVVLLENNQSGQFGKLIAEETGLQIKEMYLKYDGRSFSVDDILDYLNR